jgi:hypothetical protein
VQTGDLLYKNAPSVSVVRFWETLRAVAAGADCAVHLVAGNHEIEIWRRLASGERLGLRRRERREIRGLIRSMKLFHVEGTTLFIHGYPTVKLLRHIAAYRMGTGNGIDEYNRDCFRAALDNPKQLARYAYPRRNACRGCLLHDLEDPARYYRRHGREVAYLLRALGIETVIHGHRPERTGVQKDYELRRSIPGVRMINNDIQIRLTGLGATAIRQEGDGQTDVLFVNPRSASPKQRTQVRRLLRAPRKLAEGPMVSGSADLDGRVADFLKRRDLTAPGICAAARRMS